MIEKVIKDYTLKSPIGEGGMAIVYLAEHNTLHKPVAIKLLNKEFIHNDNIRKRFLAEARNLFSMSHPNIIKVTDLIDQEDTVAFVMEYMEGQTLKEYLDTKGKLNEEEIKKLFVQMLDAVAYVHEQGLIHRDIKPSNFMISGKGVVKLLDFGIAKNTDTTSADYTQTGTAQSMGTPMYMSPEQIKSTKEVTAQSDIYSLGVVLWQIVTGKKPYDTTTLSTFDLQLKIVSEVLPATNTKWDSLIISSTEKDILKRLSTMADFRSLFNRGIDISNFETIKNDDDKTIIEQNRIRPNVKWVEIPAGNFMMGSLSGWLNGEPGRNSNEMLHPVKLSAFKMSKYEITFEQYDIFCESTKRLKPDDEGWGRGNMPVTNVSWNDAVAFAEWMDCRLPTEAEWEYACRAGSSTSFNFGNILTPDRANFNGNYPHSYYLENTNRKKPLPVGSFLPNLWGLYDMHGNLWEWCSDWYGKDYLSTQVNPKGANKGSMRVIRGGSWLSFAMSCRSASRLGCEPELLKNMVGLRLVSNL